MSEMLLLELYKVPYAGFIAMYATQASRDVVRHLSNVSSYQ